MMRDFIVQDQTQKARECFIASINPENVKSLASSHHVDDECKIFGTKHGGFNVCFFVEFVSASESAQPDRWVVRIPIPNRVHWVEEKLDVEIATMKYVEANTSIPIPKIRAYSMARDNAISMPYIIMDYVEGYTLKELGFPMDDIWQHAALTLNRPTERVYEQLVDVYLQLRQQEFSKIGALGLPNDSRSTIQVCHRPISVEIILQTDEGLNPTKRFKEGVCFARTSDFTDALLWLAENELAKGKNPGVDIQDGRRLLYAMADFKKFVKETWLDPRFENGPFVLMHGDMSIDNMLWDRDFRLCAVLDWEWSQVVPLRFLTPPIWLLGGNAANLSQRQYFYNLEVGLFRALLRNREKAVRAGVPLLSDQWADMDKICHPLIVSALFRPENLYEVYWNYLIYKVLGIQKPRPKDIMKLNDLISTKLESFMDSSRAAFLERKAQEQTRYVQDEKIHFADWRDGTTDTKGSVPGGRKSAGEN